MRKNWNTAYSTLTHLGTQNREVMPSIYLSICIHYDKEEEGKNTANSANFHNKTQKLTVCGEVGIQYKAVRPVHRVVFR